MEIIVKAPELTKHNEMRLNFLILEEIRKPVISNNWKDYTVTLKENGYVLSGSDNNNNINDLVFISYAENFEYFSDDAKKDLTVQAIARGICNYHDLLQSNGLYYLDDALEHEKGWYDELEF